MTDYLVLKFKPLTRAEKVEVEKVCTQIISQLDETLFLGTATIEELLRDYTKNSRVVQTYFNGPCEICADQAQQGNGEGGS